MENVLNEAFVTTETIENDYDIAQIVSSAYENLN